MKTIQKSLLKTMIVLFTVFTAEIFTVAAQNQNRAEKMKGILDSRNFIFKANEVRPLAGSTRQLTGGYDVRIFKDTLTAYLPYFGQVYSAPIDPTELGIKFTSTDFAYTVKIKRKNRWQVIISPRDAKDVREMILDIFDNGSGTMQVISNNRQPITFNGYIVQGSVSAQVF